jgi:hypothetical protein
MPNLRVISDNAADRAVIDAFPVEPTLPASNLKVDSKSSVCRGSGTGKAMSITAAWDTAESFRAVALPFTNLSQWATMRVRTTNESPRTNLLLYSEAFENAVWLKTGIGATTPNATLAPDGNTTAEKIVDDTSAGAHYVRQSVSVSAGDRFAVSVFVKAAEYTTFCMRFDTSSTALNGAVTNTYVNLTNGTRASEVLAGGVTYAVTALTGTNAGWYRVIATGTAAISGVIIPFFMLATGGGVFSFTGTSGSAKGIYIWGAMLEKIGAGSVSSYYPSAGTAATRPQGYIDSWQTYAFDSTPLPCCPAPMQKLRGWTDIQAASAYGYGGGTCATQYFTTKTAVGIRIDIADPSNIQGYVEASRLIIGDYWQPADGADSGATLSVVDLSKHTRTEAGGMLTEVGPRYRKQSIPMPYLVEADRQALWNMLMSGGMAYPVFISLYPDNANAALEKAHEMYGKLVTTPVMSTPFFSVATATLEIEEI